MDSLRGFQSLPPELVVQVLSYLNMHTLASILRVSRAALQLARPIFLQALELDEMTLWRCPLAAENLLLSPSESRRYFNESREQAIAAYSSYMTALSLDLNNASEEHDRQKRDRLPFISLGDEATYVMRQQGFRDRVQSGLHNLFEALHTPATIFTVDGKLRAQPAMQSISSRLARFSLVARCEQTPGPWGPRWGQTRRAYIRQEDVVGMLDALRHCTALRSIEVDVADAEETEWIPGHGIGPACSRHVCAALSKTLACLPGVEHLSWRRRDMCSRMFDSLLAGAAPRPTNLRSLILDTRLHETQRTSLDAWEAQARPCGCGCWCTDCLARIAAAESTAADSIAAADSGKPIMYQLSRAAAAVAQRYPSLTICQVLGFGEPAKELDNWTRCPCVADCVARETRFVDVAGRVCGTEAWT